MIEFIPIGESMVPVADVIRWDWIDYSWSTSGGVGYESARLAVWLRSCPLTPIKSVSRDVRDQAKVEAINRAMSKLLPGVPGATSGMGIGIEVLLELAK